MCPCLAPGRHSQPLRPKPCRCVRGHPSRVACWGERTAAGTVKFFEDRVRPLPLPRVRPRWQAPPQLTQSAGWRQPARWAPYGRPPKLTHPSPVTVMSIRACRPRLVTASHCPCAPPPHPAVSANTHPGNPPRGIQATAEPVSRPGGGRPVGESRAPPALSSFLDPDSGRPESQKSLTVARSPLGFAPPTCQVARLRCGPPSPSRLSSRPQYLTAGCGPSRSGCGPSLCPQKT